VAAIMPATDTEAVPCKKIIFRKVNLFYIILFYTVLSNLKLKGED
jgi:hypothetical protein